MDTSADTANFASVIRLRTNLEQASVFCPTLLCKPGFCKLLRVSRLGDFRLLYPAFPLPSPLHPPSIPYLGFFPPLRSGVS